MLTVLSRIESDFFILDDESVDFNFNSLKTFINRYFNSVYTVNLRKQAELLFERNQNLFQKDNLLIIALGQGGSLVAKFLDDKLRGHEIIKSKWSRVWDENFLNHFDHDLEQYTLFGKKIVLIEDVIASGETIASAMNYIRNRGGKVIGILTATISGTSPLHKNNSSYRIIAAASLESKTYVIKNEDFNAHWFPGIYSLRHLFWGDLENPNFYKTLSDYYFNGDNIKIEIERIMR